MDDIRQLVGENVRRFREERGWSQEGLAFECVLHRTYISGVERGIRNPTVTVVARIAKALGVPPSRLLEGQVAAGARSPKRKRSRKGASR